MKNNFKQYDNVIRDLAKLNGTQAASYLLGTLDGALKRSIWQVRADREARLPIRASRADGSLPESRCDSTYREARRPIRANRAVDSAPESRCDSTSLEMQKEKQ